MWLAEPLSEWYVQYDIDWSFRLICASLTLFHFVCIIGYTTLKKVLDAKPDIYPTDPPGRRPFRNRIDKLKDFYNLDPIAYLLLLSDRGIRPHPSHNSRDHTPKKPRTLPKKPCKPPKKPAKKKMPVKKNSKRQEEEDDDESDTSSIESRETKQSSRRSKTSNRTSTSSLSSTTATNRGSNRKKMKKANNNNKFQSLEEAKRFGTSICVALLLAVDRKGHL